MVCLEIAFANGLAFFLGKFLFRFLDQPSDAHQLQTRRCCFSAEALNGSRVIVLTNTTPVPIPKG